MGSVIYLVQTVQTQTLTFINKTPDQASFNMVYLILGPCLSHFTQENEVPTTLFEAREVAGSAKIKQSKTVYIILSFMVSLFI